MTYYGGKELAEAFRTVRKNTLKIAKEIPEDKYGFRAAEGTRTVAELLTHIANADRFHQVVTLAGKNSLEGFNFQEFMAGMMAEMSKQRSKAELIALLTAQCDKFAGQLEGCTEEFLGQMVTMPPGGSPPQRSRFDMLMSVKEHEMHHRGQLMLMQRMMGLKPHLTRDAEARMAAMAAAQK